MEFTTVTPSNHPRHTIKGTVLARAITGRYSRFLVEMVRTLDANRELDVLFRVRDAHAVTDGEIRQMMAEGNPGPYSPVVGSFPTEDAALAWIKDVDIRTGK